MCSPLHVIPACFACYACWPAATAGSERWPGPRPACAAATLWLLAGLLPSVLTARAPAPAPPAAPAVRAVPQVHDLDVLHADLEEAVASEDYRTAAALKRQQTALEEADCLGAALDELDAAVGEERFAGGCWVWAAGQLGGLVWGAVVGVLWLGRLPSASCCQSVLQPALLLRTSPHHLSVGLPACLPLQTRPACATSRAWACRAGGWGAARGTAWATCCG